MSFVIGNVKDSNTINDIGKDIGGGGLSSTSKIYGISIDRNSAEIVRVYDSKDFKFNIVSYQGNTLSITPVDDFNIPGSPFDIKFVMTDYNSTTGKQEVVGTEDDANWMDLVRANTKGILDYDYLAHQAQGDSYLSNANDNPQYNWMVRFPKFYYKRPDRNTFLVSSDPISGFSPSPMHYRNGKMYNYAYVSKFCISNAINNYKSFNQANSATDIYIKASGIKPALKAQGLYLMDFATYQMIRWLLYIKYSIFNLNLLTKLPEIIWFDLIKNNTKFSSNVFKTDYGSTILPHTKDFLLVDSNSSYWMCSIMGLSNYNGFYTASTSNSVFTFIDGLAGIKAANLLLVNNDLEDMSDTFLNLNQTGWNTVPGLNSSNFSGTFTKELLYDNSYPWIVLPENSTNTYTDIAGYSLNNIFTGGGTNAVNYYLARTISGRTDLDIFDYNGGTSDKVALFRSMYVSDN